MKTTLIATLIVASFIGGTFFGFWQGINNYYRLESLPLAVLDTGMYKQIDKGKLEHVKSHYQFNIGQAIDNYIWYEENSMPVLPSVFLKEHLEEKEDYINRLVTFRRENPDEDIRHLLEGEDREFYVNNLNKRSAFISGHRAKPSPNE